MSDQIIQVTTWRAGGSAFPERAHPVLGPYLSARDDFGIALAGGGARGAAVALGATRALRAAGLLDRARYLSVTSGSVWLGGPLMYQKKDSIDDFLGRSLGPEECTVDNLTGPA